MAELFYNTVTIGVAGTRELVTGDNSLSAFDKRRVKWIRFRARTANAGFIYVGGSAVAIGRGQQIAAGAETTFDFGDDYVLLDTFYVNTGDNGDTVDVSAILENTV